MSIFQASPEGMPQTLPADLAELAASLEDGDSATMETASSSATRPTPSGMRQAPVSSPEAASGSSRNAATEEDSLSLTAAVAAAARLGYGLANDGSEAQYDQQ